MCPTERVSPAATTTDPSVVDHVTNRRRFLPAALVGLILLLGPATAQAQDIQWLRQFGTPFADGARSVATDSTGIYVVGSTANALPGQSSAGSFDAFVRKYDAAGNELWTRQFGTSAFDEALGVSADMTGIYVVGRTEGALPGQSSAGSPDAFVRKYDTAGNELWTRQFGTSGFDVAFAVAADSTGVYVAGTTDAVLPGQSSAGFCDAFFRRYDAAGNELWTRQFGTSGCDGAFAVAADSTGVYVAGSLGTVIPVGSTDAFVRKYDTVGNELWTRQFGSSGEDTTFDVSAGASGIYVVGHTLGTLPGQTSGGDTDAFIRKYDSAGTELWTKQFGTSSVDQAKGVVVDSTGVYVGGLTHGTLPGQTNAGGFDAFALALDAGGDELWTKQFGSTLTDMGEAIALDASGVYAVGALGPDAFVAKLTKAAPPTIADLIEDVQALGLSQGLETSLVVKLERAQAALSVVSSARMTSGCNLLKAFAAEVVAQSGKATPPDQADALVAKAEQVATVLGCPAGVAIHVFQSLSTFSAANRVGETITFDELETGSSVGNPALLGSLNVLHSSAATFKTIGSPAYNPESSPNVLAPFRPDDTLEFGDTTLTFAKSTRAAGLFLVLPRGSNQDTIWTSTVTATDTKDQSITVSVTFQGVFGEQQFIGFKSRFQLVSISFSPAIKADASSVLALDNLMVE